MWGVGIIGAGSVTQTIHMPTLDKMSEVFRIQAVADVDFKLASEVSARYGAQGFSDYQSLIEHPKVDVVVICSPDRFHSDQLVKACEARKKVVLCEKPLTTNTVDAERIASIAAEMGTDIVVGSMHVYDQAWLNTVALWRELRFYPRLIRSRIYLPYNDHFEHIVTELIGSPAETFHSKQQSAPSVLNQMLSLGIHDIPLIRQLLVNPKDVEVLSAVALPQNGYQIIVKSSDQAIELNAHFSHNTESDWTLEAYHEDAYSIMTFTPSFVHSGSAESRIVVGEQETKFGPYVENGYENEWYEIARILNEGDDTSVALTDLVEDIEFGLRIGKKAENAIAKTKEVHCE